MTTIRRILFVALMAAALVGGSSVPASAGYEVCPWVKLFGNYYEICIPVP